MAAPVPNQRFPTGGVTITSLAATSGVVAAATCSARLTGITSTQIFGLTQAIVTSTGATSAACKTFQITGLTSTQLSGQQMNMIFGVPAGAGVPATPLIANFDPPLLGAPGADIVAEIASLGSGHAGITINLLGKIMPAPGS